MSNPSALKQVLRSLDVEDLQAIRREHAERVSSGYNRENLIQRLWDSLNGRISVSKLMETALAEVQKDRRQHLTRIKHALERLVFSEHVTGGDASRARENWMCSEAFQALRYELGNATGKTDYFIELEKGSGQEGVDLCVTYDDGEGRPMRYLIEAKRARNRSGMRGLSNQLSGYEETITYWKHSIGLIIAERETHLPENNRLTRRMQNDLEDRERTDCILKRPSDFQDPF